MLRDCYFNIYYQVGECIFNLIYQKKKADSTAGKGQLLKNSLFIITAILLLALTEEYLWDLFVYRDNPDFFSSIFPYNMSIPGQSWQIIATAVLSLPQLTHYIIDGFIWKNNSKNPHLKAVFQS